MLIFWLLLHFHCALCSGDGVISKEKVDWFLEQLGQQVINDPPTRPIEFMDHLSRRMEMDYTQVLQIADLPCQISQDIEHLPVIIPHSGMLIAAGCKFLQRISAQMLFRIGKTIDEASEESLIAITAMHEPIVKKFVYFKQVQPMFPFVCQEARAGMLFRPVYRKKTGISDDQYREYIKLACDLFERMAVDFLNGFVSGGYTERAQWDLHVMLGSSGGITTTRRITYGHVSAMLPDVCQGKMGTQHLQRNPGVPEACEFFEKKTAEVLTSISKILGGDDMENKRAIGRYHSGEGKAYCHHRAKPFMYTACVEGGLDWHRDPSKWWNIPACNYFLTNHLEEMVKPKRE